MININITKVCFCLGLGLSSLSFAGDVGGSIGLKNKSFYFHLESCKASDQGEVYVSTEHNKDNTGIVHNLRYIDQIQSSYDSGFNEEIDLSKFKVGTSFINNCGVNHDKACFLSINNYQRAPLDAQLFNPRYQMVDFLTMYGNYAYFDFEKEDYYIPRNKSEADMYQKKILLGYPGVFNQRPYGYKKINGIIRKGGEFSMSYRKIVSSDDVFQNVECNVVKNVDNTVVGVFGVALQAYDSKGDVPAGISYSPYLNVSKDYNLIYREDPYDRHNGEDAFVSYSLNDKQEVPS